MKWDPIRDGSSCDWVLLGMDPAVIGPHSGCIAWNLFADPWNLLQTTGTFGRPMEPLAAHQNLFGRPLSPLAATLEHFAAPVGPLAAPLEPLAAP